MKNDELQTGTMQYRYTQNPTDIFQRQISSDDDVETAAGGSRALFKVVVTCRSMCLPSFGKVKGGKVVLNMCVTIFKIIF